MKQCFLLPISAVLFLIIFPYVWGGPEMGLQAQPTSYVIDSAGFTQTGPLETGTSETQVKMADLDQDGNLDIYSIGDHGAGGGLAYGGLMAWFGNGTGTNWTWKDGLGPGNYGGCAVGDLNNDGKQDMACGCHHCAPVMDATLGDGTGMMNTGWNTGLATNGENWGMFGTDLGDVNNDGFLDIACNSFGGSNGTRIYKSLGNGSWQQTLAAGVGGNSEQFVQFGDIDGDGNIDFVTSLQAGAAWFGNGTGGFVAKNSGLPSGGIAGYGDVCLGDMDNDGDDDFAFIDANDAIRVYKWNKAAQQWSNSSTGLPASGTDGFMCSRFGDMDMDGYLDLVTGSYNNQSVQIWKGNGGASWTNTINVPISSLYNIHDIAIGDVDHSGYPDIFIWEEWAEVSWPIAVTQNTVKLLKDMVVPNDLTSTLTYPKGGECWPNNGVRFITWVSAIPGNHSSSVKIEYSTTGTSGPWILIAAAAPNNGIYQWKVSGSSNSSNCYVRITAKDNVTSNTAVTTNPVAFNIGCSGSSTGLQETADANDVSVFPNPLGSAATIYAPTVIHSINIIDLTGNVVRTFSDVNQSAFTIERGNLAAGIYVLQVQSENSPVSRIKLVVE